MSIKKILILAIILSLLTVGAVSAYETTDQLVKIANDNGYTYHNNITDLPEDDFAQNFTKDSGYVMICYKEKGNLSAEAFGHFENKTINNTKGVYSEMDGDYYFHFQHGDEVVYTRSNDKSMLEKLAIGNGDENTTANATDNATANATANATDNKNSDDALNKLEKNLADNGYANKQDENNPDYNYSYKFTKGTNYVVISCEKDTKLSKDNFMSGFEDKTISNTKGIYMNDSGKYLFHYQHGNDILLTRTNDPSIIEKIVIGN